MLICIRKKEIIGLLCLVLFLAGFATILWRGADSREAAVFSSKEALSPVTVVIDPGHGGEDGGAVAGDGTVESTLNLAIAKHVQELLLFTGQSVVMTREEDISLHSEGAQTIREKKASDLSNRVAVVQDTANAVLISIHQNSLPEAPSVHGAQVFYGDVSGSEAMADSVQKSLNATVNLGNEKKSHPISSSIYLMKHAGCPAILVECGFLSNQSETALLKENAYQMRLAAAIASGFLSASYESNFESISEGTRP